MADKGVPSSDYKLLTKLEITDVNKRNTSDGKLLKTAFLLGPSKPVLKYGKVKLASDDTSDSTESTDSAESSSQSSDSAESSSQSSEESYSIYDSYVKLTRKYEDDSNGTFEVGSIVTISVQLPYEGCTVWELAISKNADEDSIIDTLISKKFKAAYLSASANSSTDGLVPLSMATYINTKAKCNCPFIGNCRFSFDSGTEGSSDLSGTVSLAVAPVDVIKKKPSLDSMMSLVYNVVGDITDGKIGQLKQLITNFINNKDNDSNDQNDIKNLSDELSKFIKSKFKNTGDQTMYSEFVKIRDYIEKQIAAKNLEFNKDDSDGPLEFVKFSSNKNKLFYY